MLVDMLNKNICN